MLPQFSANEKIAPSSTAQSDADLQDVRKRSLRKKLISLRAGLDPRAAEKKSFAAQDALLASSLWRNAGRVAMYASINAETSTWRLLETAWRQGKTALLPRIIDRKSAAMIFLACNGFADLERGPCGIPQPRAGKEGEAPQLLIVPGVAFDLAGGRLGYGGGYYDRYLSKHPGLNSLAIGFCYSLQILGHVPMDNMDVPMGMLCCEEGLHGCGSI